MLHNNNVEREEMVSRYEAEKQELTNEIIAVQRERDDSLLLAENEKQQVKLCIGDSETVNNFFLYDSYKTRINLRWPCIKIYISLG